MGPDEACPAGYGNFHELLLYSIVSVALAHRHASTPLRLHADIPMYVSHPLLIAEVYHHSRPLRLPIVRRMCRVMSAVCCWIRRSLSLLSVNSVPIDRH